jgi:ATP-binding cassette subfamily B multidrug efflux pump
MKTIIRFLKPYKKLCIFTILFIIFDILGTLYIPTITADMINTGIGSKDIDYIMQRGFIMLGVTILSGAGALIGSYLCSKLASNMGRDIRNALYKKSLTFSHFDFKQFGTGSMITRTLNDVNVIQQTVVSFIQMVIPVPIMCISGIIMAFRIDNFMGFLLLGITIIIILAAIFITRKASVIFEKLQRFLDKMNVILRENITGVRVIRAFNKEEHEKNRLKNSFEQYAESAIKANKLYAGLDCLAFFAINLCIVTILYIGGNRVGIGAMQIGDITAVTEYAILILFYLIMAQMVLILMPRAGICLKRVKEVLETEPEIKDGKRKMKKSNSIDVIRFKDMTFRFSDADEDTLCNLKFTCKRGQTTAIIGSTGSGKSTIAKLIMRFHDVTKGSILLNEQDLKTLSKKEIREHIAYVPQTAWLFSGTIADNLRYGNENATEDEMYHALKVAQAEFVEKLEDGLQTNVAQGGTNFSGGQKQRLCIARALIKKADIYVFDDSFSALDFKTDRNLRKALAKELKNAAVLIIAQRINTILNADQIIVLNDGKVVGIGKHHELMENCTIYQEIAKSQMKGDVNHV